jgi:hypothetical protein
MWSRKKFNYKRMELAREISFRFFAENRKKFGDETK